MGGKHFTAEEEEYIERNFGHVTLKSMAKRLGRTIRSIEGKAHRMGLSSSFEGSGKITAAELARLVGRDPKVVYRWIRLGLPASTKSLITGSHKNPRYILIDSEDFWTFAEQHKDQIDFLLIERNTILPEPEWVEVERRKQLCFPIQKKKRWTPREEKRIWEMYYVEGKLQKEIAEVFGVKESTISIKIKRLRDKGGQRYINTLVA